MPIVLGIGSIPDAVLAELKNHKDLGIHSEMFAGGVIDLVKVGALTNNKKTLNQGKIISSFLIGPKELYDFVDNNPFIGEFYKCNICSVVGYPTLGYKIRWHCLQAKRWFCFFNFRQNIVDSSVELTVLVEIIVQWISKSWTFKTILSRGKGLNLGDLSKKA